MNKKQLAAANLDFDVSSIKGDGGKLKKKILSEKFRYQFPKYEKN